MTELITTQEPPVDSQQVIGINALAVPESEIKPPPVVIIQPVQESGLSGVRQALQSRALVVALLVVAGPMGLPALWFSPSFGNWTKWFVSIAYVSVTLVLPIALIVYFLEVSLWPLVEAFRSLPN